MIRCNYEIERELYATKYNVTYKLDKVLSYLKPKIDITDFSIQSKCYMFLKIWDVETNSIKVKKKCVIDS